MDGHHVSLTKYAYLQLKYNNNGTHSPECSLGFIMTGSSRYDPLLAKNTCTVTKAMSFSRRQYLPMWVKISPLLCQANDISSEIERCAHVTRTNMILSGTQKCSR
jgi:hypothetical protein